MSKIIDGVIGHAIGDAMGTPVQFQDRKLFYKPVTEMLNSAAGDKGTWSDDTSMEIATIDSYINCSSWDYEDIMKNFYDWLNEAKYTSRGITFDVGTTCLRAVKNYYNGISPLESGLDDMRSNGNGSLMRILPVAYYCYYKKINNEEVYKIVKDISSLTHRHEIAILGCYIYVLYVMKLLDNKDMYEAYEEIKKEDYSKFSKESLECYKRILTADIFEKGEDDIKSSGYVVDSLETSLWCFLNTDNYKDSIITAVNLGGDTDPIAAITGSMSGIVYGYKSFPKEWVEALARREYIEDLCKKFEKELNK